MVWIIGEYADRIDNANELLEQVCVRARAISVFFDSYFPFCH
jgi:hypothetical protein